MTAVALQGGSGVFRAGFRDGSVGFRGFRGGFRGVSGGSGRFRGVQRI